MDNMYQNIIPSNQRKAPRGRRTLGILLGIVLLVALICLFPLVRIMIHQNDYKQFVSALSTATYRTSTTGVLTAEIDGTTISIQKDNVYGLYGVIVKQGPCYIANEQPQREPDVHLTYGIFGTMDLWDVPLENDPNGFTSGVYIQFTSTTEEKLNFSYIMVGKPLRDIMSLYLSPELNSIVE